MPGRGPDPARGRAADSAHARGVDLVLECSGRFRKQKEIEALLGAGARRVVVPVPVRDGPSNVVVGVNHEAFDLASEAIGTRRTLTIPVESATRLT